MIFITNCLWERKNREKHRLWKLYLYGAIYLFYFFSCNFAQFLNQIQSQCVRGWKKAIENYSNMTWFCCCCCRHKMNIYILHIMYFKRFPNIFQWKLIEKTASLIAFFYLFICRVPGSDFVVVVVDMVDIWNKYVKIYQQNKTKTTGY